MRTAGPDLGLSSSAASSGPGRPLSPQGRAPHGPARLGPGLPGRGRHPWTPTPTPRGPARTPCPPRSYAARGATCSPPPGCGRFAFSPSALPSAIFPRLRLPCRAAHARRPAAALPALGPPPDHRERAGGGQSGHAGTAFYGAAAMTPAEALLSEPPGKAGKLAVTPL